MIQALFDNSSASFLMIEVQLQNIMNFLVFFIFSKVYLNFELLFIVLMIFHKSVKSSVLRFQVNHLIPHTLHYFSFLPSLLSIDRE